MSLMWCTVRSPGRGGIGLPAQHASEESSRTDDLHREIRAAAALAKKQIDSQLGLGIKATVQALPMVVPRGGRLVESGDRYEPCWLIDPDGATIVAVALYFQELLAPGKTPSTVRSYGMGLLRRWRFLQAVDLSW
ncbi:hypothetical protein [Streptomyces sp. NPDC096013]|uniref:hypothetical protein n=1 Tax=Streptomyces sp. NPDC096013 TaxID=3366069 RepID=UPI0037FD00FA